jgi:hypothetical protein
MTIGEATYPSLGLDGDVLEPHLVALLHATEEYPNIDPA